MSIQIRNATEGDFSTIQLVARLSWAEAYRELIPVSVQKNICKQLIQLIHLEINLKQRHF